MIVLLPPVASGIAISRPVWNKTTFALFIANLIPSRERRSFISALRFSSCSPRVCFLPTVRGARANLRWTGEKMAKRARVASSRVCSVKGSISDCATVNPQSINANRVDQPINEYLTIRGKITIWKIERAFPLSGFRKSIDLKVVWTRACRVIYLPSCEYSCNFTKVN